MGACRCVMTVKTSDANYPCCCCLPKRYSILLMPRKLKSPHKGINDKSSRKLCLFLLLFVLIFYVMGSSAKKQTTTNSSSFVQRLARAVKTGCLVQANQTKGERATRLDNPEIKSKYGKVRGVKVDLGDPDLKPVVKFLGIPYAQPPIGKLRWRKTEAPMKWNGLYDVFRIKKKKLRIWKVCNLRNVCNNNVWIYFQLFFTNFQNKWFCINTLGYQNFFLYSMLLTFFKSLRHCKQFPNIMFVNIFPTLKEVLFPYRNIWRNKNEAYLPSASWQKPAQCVTSILV